MWVFNLAVNLLVPAIMIIGGSILAKHAPKNINSVCGYRTTMSMKNRDTWEFAHHYFGKVWRLVGWILLPLSVAAMLLVRGKDEYTVDIYGVCLILAQTVVLLVSIAPTERALRKNFDENGNRRE